MNHTTGFGSMGHITNLDTFDRRTKQKIPEAMLPGFSYYFAYSTALVSRITLILI